MTNDIQERLRGKDEEWWGRRPAGSWTPDGVLVEAADAIDKRDAAIAELVEALQSQLVKKPSDDASDGPCCSSYSDKSNCWLSDGCTCSNGGDAERAEYWRHDMNKFIEQEPIRALISKHKGAS